MSGELDKTASKEALRYFFRRMAAAARSAADKMVEINPDLARSEDSGLSPDELDFLPEAASRPWKPSGLPVAEIDCDLRIPGHGEVAVTLSVWGTFHKAHKGGHEPGERAYEPDDEAGFEIEAVMWGDTDVTGELGQAGESTIAAYVMENCEPDEDWREDFEARR